MHLSPTEEARLRIFQAAELARRNRDDGLALNAPEAIAIACDEMHLAARAGGSIEDVLAAGRASVAPEDLMDGVADLIAEIRLEVLLDEGTRLVVLRGLAARDDDEHPGEVVTVVGEVTINAGLDPVELAVTNTRTTRSVSRRTSRSIGSTRGSRSTGRLRAASGWTSRRATPCAGRPARRARSGSCGSPRRRLMPFGMSRDEYARRYGPTTGDRVRLGDTDLWIGSRTTTSGSATSRCGATRRTSARG